MTSSTVRSLRVLSVISFIPGFALLIPSGVESRRILPAIGLLPLFFSSAFNAFLVSTGSRSSPVRIHARGDDGGESQLRPGSEERDSSFEEKHPIVVFLIDTIFAGSLMVVLVVSFITMNWWRWMSPGVVILGTYATLPLLMNFFIHAWLAIRAFTIGTGLSGLFNRIRYRGIPADCPGCGSNIRPSTPSTPPWFQSVSVPTLSYRQVSFSVPPVKVPAILGQPRDWKTPAWMKGGVAPESESLIANQEGAETSDAAYRDDYDEDAVTVRPSLDAPAAQQPEEVVVTKKDKGKSTDEPASW